MSDPAFWAAVARIVIPVAVIFAVVWAVEAWLGEKGDDDA